MTGFAKFRDGLIGPTLILFGICLVMTFALAFTFNITKPVIAQGEIDAANAVRAEVLPGGKEFEPVKGQDYPEGVLEVTKCTSGAEGFVIKSQSKGFGGQVTYMIGFDKSGNVAGIRMFEHSETPGLGTKVADEAYLGRYLGDVNPETVDAITGATKTSNSLKYSLMHAKQAFEQVKEAA